MRFEGSKTYVATDDLRLAVNAAITLARPLLIKGEPGTGKTRLAEEVAEALGMPLLEWHVKSTTRAQQGLYEYDAVSRLRDSQLGDPRVRHRQLRVPGLLWQAFVRYTGGADRRDRQGRHQIPQRPAGSSTGWSSTSTRRQLIKAKHRPLVFITSNSEDLPGPASLLLPLHPVPGQETMERIVECTSRSESPAQGGLGPSSACARCRA